LIAGVPSGDSAILSYNLQWDAGTQDDTQFADLIGNPTNSLATQYTVTSMIAPGGFYRFRVRASNIYGFGVFSNIYSFKASEEP
jgi:hypothetical protein